MSILDRLASAQGLNSTDPNKQLAQELAESGDENAIRELAEGLGYKNKRIQSDCIKTLYEIGERKPALIAAYDEAFLKLLDDKNNRLVWGAMTALDCITALNPDKIYAKLAKIMEVTDKGTVITRDHCVGILAQLASVNKYADDALTLLFEQMQSCPTNQFPAYCEKTLPVINDAHKEAFIKLMESRKEDMETDSKKKRVEKVLKKLKAK